MKFLKKIQRYLQPPSMLPPDDMWIVINEGKLEFYKRVNNDIYSWWYNFDTLSDSLLTKELVEDIYAMIEPPTGWSYINFSKRPNQTYAFNDSQTALIHEHMKNKDKPQNENEDDKWTYTNGTSFKEDENLKLKKISGNGSAILVNEEGEELIIGKAYILQIEYNKVTINSPSRQKDKIILVPEAPHNILRIIDLDDIEIARKFDTTNWYYVNDLTYYAKKSDIEKIEKEYIILKDENKIENIEIKM